MNDQMKLVSLVRVHILEVITMLNDIEIIKALIDEEILVV